MKARKLVLTLAAAALLVTSGCHWCRFPNLGWRLHSIGSNCGPCTPAFSSPARGPVVGYPVGGHGPAVQPDCPGCGVGGPHVPVGYPPVIGNPIPLPGPTVVPSTELPHPMPVPGKTGN